MLLKQADQLEQGTSMLHVCYIVFSLLAVLHIISILSAVVFTHII